MPAVANEAFWKRTAVSDSRSVGRILVQAASASGAEEEEVEAIGGVSVRARFGAAVVAAAAAEEVEVADFEEDALAEEEVEGLADEVEATGAFDDLAFAPAAAAATARFCSASMLARWCSSAAEGFEVLLLPFEAVVAARNE